jgi:hypothetical protein
MSASAFFPPSSSALRTHYKTRPDAFQCTVYMFEWTQVQTLRRAVENSNGMR